MFGRQVTLGQSHSRHQPPGGGGAGSWVEVWFLPHVLRREDFVQRHTGPFFCLEGDPSLALCSQGPLVEWMEL